MNIGMLFGEVLQQLLIFLSCRQRQVCSFWLEFDIGEVLELRDQLNDKVEVAFGGVVNFL